MWALLGFVAAAWLFHRVYHRLELLRVRGAHQWAAAEVTRSWRPDRMHRQWEREMRRWKRKHKRYGRWHGDVPAPPPEPTPADLPEAERRRHGKSELAFSIHLLAYLGVMTLLALLNFFTSSTTWFIWPAMGWGVGLFAHWMAHYGGQLVKARVFDPAVAREVQAETAALQSEKQADIGELSSTIAHEIRNPIAAAKSLVQQMAEDPQSIENVEYARVAVEELDRVERRIAHLLRYAREEDYVMAPVGLASVVDGALTQLRARLEDGGVQAVRSYIGGPTVQADAEKLQGVFANLIGNAVDALATCDKPRRIELCIENGGAAAVVRVRDNGPGIPPGQRDKIFNPFFTTKASGTGLGLAIAKKTVEAHGGTLELANGDEPGTEFAVTLPLPR